MGFFEDLPFNADPFQREGCRVVDEGNSVLVCAPTGAGKTVVGEYAVYAALQRGVRAFYTAPIKALSNQKFTDLSERYGRDNVGLLTGDTVINRDAPILVMTTEVLRNMLYAEAREIPELGYVVMDEVHYLADRTRGAVWEEVIIHLPQHVQLVALSATISNADEFVAWLRTVRGTVELVQSDVRPVPLAHHVLVGGKILDLFDADKEFGGATLNPHVTTAIRQGITRGDRDDGDGRRGRHGHGGRGRGGRDRGRQPHQRRGRGGPRDRQSPTKVVGHSVACKELAANDMLPAIYFIFSRQGCDRAVQQCMTSGLRLTTPQQARVIRARADAACSTIPDPDLRVLGYAEWLAGLTRGVAAHHAGLLPTFKRVVEELFEEGLLKVVFATETLALGVNLPARSVFIEKMVKFDGEGHVELTAGQYTQLTGRAGRRGLDTIGHAVVMHRAGLDPKWLASLASARNYPLKSSFVPSYNMAVNLLERLGAAKAREVLQSSYAQFQADRNAVGLARSIAEERETLEGYKQAMSCHVGDFDEYMELRRMVSTAEKNAKKAPPREAEAILREAAAHRRLMKMHPCHGCKDRESHARWSDRVHHTERSIRRKMRTLEDRTGNIVSEFDRVCKVLETTRYIAPGEAPGDYDVTDDGQHLRRIYSESDLLVAECLRREVWMHLGPEELAGVVSTLVYSPRGDTESLLPLTTADGVRSAWFEMTAVLADIHAVEKQHKVSPTKAPDAGALSLMLAWAHGATLEAVLTDADVTAGDFVRLARQTVDVLDQIRVAADGETVGDIAEAAVLAVHRGVVATASTAEG